MELMNRLYNIFPSLNEKDAWLDINKNNKKEINELVSIRPDDSGRHEIDYRDKLVFLAKNFMHLQQNQQDKVIVESMKLVFLNTDEASSIEAQSLLFNIGEPSIPEALKYLDKTAFPGRSSIYSLLLSLSDKEIKNIDYMEKVCLPKLHQILKNESEYKVLVNLIIKNFTESLKKAKESKRPNA